MKTLVLAALFLPGPAHADLSFVQITQGQTSKEGDGVFGKTWVEVKDGRMRLVSGYARRLPEDREEAALEPRRIVQVLDIPGRRRVVMHPERKAYAQTRLGAVDYGNEIYSELRRGDPDWRIVDIEVVLEKKLAVRKMMGVDATHHRIRAKLTLASPDDAKAIAHMEQNIWVAPVGGKLFKPLLDLLTFENDYRRATGGTLSPLDHERYQIKEVAGYLRLPQGELQRVVRDVRERFRDFAGYPVASAVAWWREDAPAAVGGGGGGVALGDIKPQPPKHRYSNTGARFSRYRPRRAMKPKRPHKQVVAANRARFKVINWRRHEKEINDLYATTLGQFPMGTLQRPGRRRAETFARRAPRREGMPEPEADIYPQFEEELRKVLKILVDVQDQERAAGEAEPRQRGLPFYEVYSELHGLEHEAVVPQEAFLPPPSWRRVRR